MKASIQYAGLIFAIIIGAYCWQSIDVGKIYEICDLNQSCCEETYAMEWINSGERKLELVDENGRNFNLIRLDVDNKFGNEKPFIGLMEDFLTEDECRELLKIRNENITLFKQDDNLVDDSRAKIYFNSTNARSLVFKLPPFLERRAKLFSYDDLYYRMKDYIGRPDNKVGIIEHYDNSYYTLIIYLNTVPIQHGGATVFTKLNIKIQPKMGTAIWFRNMLGKIPKSCFHRHSLPKLSRLMLHQADPLLYGEKIIIQFQTFQTFQK